MAWSDQSARRALIAAKVLLAVLLVVGALWPQVGGFEGKGMAYRLPLFLAPALVVPIRSWRGHGWPIGLDAALTLPFLFDTLGNALGLYDAFDRTDDVLHFVNWFVLGWGLTAHLRDTRRGDRVLLWLAGTGLGALLIIWWEAAEWLVMESGVGGLELTYADTVADLLLSSTGGALGAWVAVRHRHTPSPAYL